MAYKIRPGVHLVCVKDHAGKVRYHYANPRPKSGDFGPVISSISPEQAAYLIRIGFIEPIDDVDTDIAQLGGQDRVNDLIATLDSLGVTVDAGAPTAREALRDAGHAAPNDLIATAIKIRKTLPRTAV